MPGMGLGIIALCLLGLFAGVIAKWLLPGKDPGGFLLTMLLGIAGAFLGGFIAREVWHVNLERFFDMKTWLAAIGGSLILLVGYRLLRRVAS
jgi:uncharacterized membrane protein YeaQ/YmgE (transglycosylase-associated protein family)